MARAVLFGSRRVTQARRAQHRTTLQRREKSDLATVLRMPSGESPALRRNGESNGCLWSGLDCEELVVETLVVEKCIAEEPTVVEPFDRVHPL